MVRKDELSGIEKFEVWFGSIGGSAVLDWSDMLEDTVHYLTDLGLEHANEYFTQVRITDNAGNESVVFSSDGVLVDLESPIPGGVIDGLENDEEFTSSPKHFKCFLEGI